MVNFWSITFQARATPPLCIVIFVILTNDFSLVTVNTQMRPYCSQVDPELGLCNILIRLLEFTASTLPFKGLESFNLQVQEESLTCM